MAGGQLLLLRRPGGQARGCDDPRRCVRHTQLHAPRTVRPGGLHYRVEFTPVDRHLEDGACAGSGQHDRAETLGARVGFHA